MAALLLREARSRQGISQRRLALRAKTSQDAISRIERGVEEPTLERLAHLMTLGERLEVKAVPLSKLGLAAHRWSRRGWRSQGPKHERPDIQQRAWVMSEAPERPLDLQQLFRVLAEHSVDYLVIGGVAAQVHGRRRQPRISTSRPRRTRRTSIASRPR